jgi:putative oxidoreductase
MRMLALDIRPAHESARSAGSKRLAFSDWAWCGRSWQRFHCRRTLQLCTQEGHMKVLIDGLIGWPERVAKHLDGWAPLFGRIVVGWVFLWSGWGKLHSLPAIVENFAGWHIPAPQILAPFVSGVEFFGGLFLLLGLLTRISAGALGVTMIVAIVSAKWSEVDSLETLLGFDETEYLALFLWLAVFVHVTSAIATDTFYRHARGCF